MQREGYQHVYGELRVILRVVQNDTLRRIWVSSETVVRQVQFLGWPGLEGDRPKPRGFPHFVQSSPGHPILIPELDGPLRSLLVSLDLAISEAHANLFDAESHRVQ